MVCYFPRVLNLVDPARLAIFVICLLLITHASQKAVKLDKENRDDINKEGEREKEREREREKERERVRERVSM